MQSCGGTANSKLFQNVREKASLAYTAGSSYIKAKNNIFIKCGIEIANYEKAVKIIKEQLEDMKNGKFEEVDIEDAKRAIISNVKTITEEQDTEITYYFGQEISDVKYTLDEYVDRINKISKEQIQSLAKKVKINTIYFLRD
ncbi:MAG: insulinase family protein [Clostridia bacterium]|nr:insulinase family protein [Clostridia bacterium]